MLRVISTHIRAIILKTLFNIEVLGKVLIVPIITPTMMAKIKLETESNAVLRNALTKVSR